MSERLRARDYRDPEDRWDDYDHSAGRRSCEEERPIRSGDVLVTMGHDGRLKFKGTTFLGSCVDQRSCGFRPLMDGNGLYLHMCWHFYTSALNSMESRKLLLALQKVVLILKELDCNHAQRSRNPDLDCGKHSDESELQSNIRTIPDAHTKVAKTERVSSPEDAVDEVSARESELVRRRFASDNGSLKRRYTERDQATSAKRDSEEEGRGAAAYGKESVRAHSFRQFQRSDGGSELYSFENGTAYDDGMSIDPERGSKISPNAFGIRHLKTAARNVNLSNVCDGSAKENSGLHDEEMEDLNQKLEVGDNLNSGNLSFAADHDHGWNVHRQQVQPSVPVKEEISESLHYRDTEFSTGTGNPSNSAPDMREGIRSYIHQTTPSAGDASRVNHQSMSDVHPQVKEELFVGDANGVEHQTMSDVHFQVKVKEEFVGDANGGNHQTMSDIHSLVKEEFVSQAANDPVGSAQNIQAAPTSKKDVTMISVPEVDAIFKHWEAMGDKQKIVTILEQFQFLEKHYKCMFQTRQMNYTGHFRPDLKAGKYLLRRGFCLNHGYSVAGPIPGVEIGDTFRYREELLLLVIHRAQQAGIDYITAAKSNYKNASGQRVPVAVSIVASGGYKDNQDNGNNTTLIYSGQGGKQNLTMRHGHSKLSRKQCNLDQELVRGNLALVNSCKLKVPVRVTRGVTANDRDKKVYVYDGMWDVISYNEEVGSSGNKVWKFKLVRIPGQKTFQFPTQ